MANPLCHLGRAGGCLGASRLFPGEGSIRVGWAPPPNPRRGLNRTEGRERGMLRTAVSPLGLGLTQGPPTSQAFALDLDTPPGPLGLQLADGGGGQWACSAPMIAPASSSWSMSNLVIKHPHVPTGPSHCSACPECPDRGDFHFTDGDAEAPRPAASAERRSLSPRHTLCAAPTCLC